MSAKTGETKKDRKPRKKLENELRKLEKKLAKILRKLDKKRVKLEKRRHQTGKRQKKERKRRRVAAPAVRATKSKKIRARTPKKRTVSPMRWRKRVARKPVSLRTTISRPSPGILPPASAPNPAPKQTTAATPAPIPPNTPSGGIATDPG